MKICSKKLFLVFVICLDFSLSLLFVTFVSAPRQVKVGYFLMNQFQELDQSGLYHGYSFDYLQKIRQYAEWDITFVQCEYQDCLRLLADGEIDLINYVEKNQKTENNFLFSLRASGTEYAAISVLEENFLKYPANLKIPSGFRLGALSGSKFIDAIEDNLTEFEQTPELLEYPQEKLYSALESGEIDGILSSSITVFPGTKVISRFSLRPFYFVVRNGNDRLLKELNRAMNLISLHEPLFVNRLYEKYYAYADSEVLYLTKEEADFLSDKKTFRVIIAPDGDPVSYYLNGSYHGIIADFLNKTARDLNVEIEPVEAASFEEALDKIRNGEADILGDFLIDEGFAEKNNLQLSPAFLESQVVAVYKKGNDVSVKNPVKIAEPNNYQPLSSSLRAIYSKSEVTYYESDAACLDAVNTGGQDISFINIWAAQKNLGKMKYHDLVIDPNQGFTLQYSYAVSRNADPRLVQILRKAINSISSFQRFSIINQNVFITPQKVRLIDFINTQPAYAFFIFLVFPILFLYLLAYRIDSHQKDKKQIFNLAFVDDMTQLKNLHWMEKNAGRIIEENRSKKFAFISFDVDRFDIINEYYGRKTGDQIIQYMADTLMSIDVPGMICTRVKADHFLCLVPYESREILEKKISDIKSKKNSYSGNDTVIKFGIHVGVYILSDSDQDITACIDNAETARREARNVSSGIVFFDDYLKDKLRVYKHIEEMQESALENHEFEVYYQPKYNMEENSIIGAEALIRWNDPVHGIRMPSDFIPIFEKNGFIIQIDFFVLEEVCKFLHSRIDAGEKVVPISVNQSRVHLSEKHYVQRLGEIIRKYSIPDGLIELELTETAISEIDDVENILNQAKALNYRISIDDFGTGYSSLTMLNRVPLDAIKIDRNFLIESNNSKKTREIIRLVVEMAHALGIQVVCEGVEKQDQADFLMSIGCRFGQGFLFSKPIPINDFMRIL
jgi:diguanylate cyclase (GGDEF)-like protein